MDIRAGIGSLKSQSFWNTSQRSISSCNFPCSSFKTFCSKKDSQQQPQQNGDDNNGDKFSTDWDKAWSNFKKQTKRSFLSGFSPNKYVTWNPRQSNYPLSEEVDPIKRTERSNLMLWTSPGFTLVGAIIIVSFLLLYTILAPVK
ncbi:2,3-bisphosphoglycerate-independent phosphoglycerate mutase [Gossypium australe]|uniref:2,3-bisphosphoglycerate-independent phosphoglycerate mutase n=1 Tax=Gossypium australe TaxID=47621 RepID=A0A5B6V468_9ROSI|nr:2,3-bisphosphoglycerate-independent phosphoglycerate mutase [Gossypium australe]